MEAATTMGELAKELGLSRLTVSAIVNYRAQQMGISPATIARVREHLDRRGFVPSKSALALRAPPQERIGILYPGALYSHLTEAFNLISEALAGAPERLELMRVPRDGLVAAVKELIARGVTRLVWIQVNSSQQEFSDPTLLRYLERLTVIVYNFPFGEDDGAQRLIDLNYHLIGVDRGQGYRSLAGRLHALGHRRVALPILHGEGYSAAFNELGIATMAMPVSDPAAPLAETSLDLARRIHAAMREHGVTAACFHDDELAGRAMKDLEGMGVRIPEDLTVTGFDGLELAALFRVPLTTVRVPVARMVERVLRILEQGGRPQRHRFILETNAGASHAPPPQLQEHP